MMLVVTVKDASKHLAKSRVRVGRLRGRSPAELGVHRATVYRWLEDAAFADALRTASEEFYREHRAKVLAAEAARQRWREERERERRPMRCANLARARAARGR